MRCASAGIVLGLFFALVPCAVHAAPLVAIVIDDLGDDLDAGLRSVELPAPVTCSFLPKTPFAGRLARLAHEREKEVMLHLPMESIAGLATGPGALTLAMTEAEVARTLNDDFASIPHVRGVNNHMGSLITRHPGHMSWVMEQLLQRQGMYFVDSRTTPLTVAQRMAWEHGVPNTRRNLFLDYARDRATIRRQFEHLLRMARERGSALGIGHPYPETLDVLEQMLPSAEANGVRIVPVSELINAQKRRANLWQASWSPLQKGAKNSKR